MLIYYNLSETEFQEPVFTNHKFFIIIKTMKEKALMEEYMAEKRKKFEVPEQKENGVRINKYLGDLS